MADIEARAIRAFEALGVLMTNTCINYQTILPPVRGEHLAMGDTGVVASDVVASIAPTLLDLAVHDLALHEDRDR